MHTASNILDEELHLIGGGTFLPAWDSTDHLNFVCQKCKSVADVLEIKFDNNSYY